MQQIAPVERSKETARHTYDKLSSWYDLLAESSERRFRTLGINLLAPSEGESILEIGVGTGRALAPIASRLGDEGRLYGIDISSGMLAVAQRRAVRAKVDRRVQLVQGDATALPYQDGSMDAVFLSFTLELFDTPEIPVVLSECRRVLRAHGRLCVISLAKEESTATRVYEWVHHVLPAMVDCRPIYTGDALEAAGFGITATRRAHDFGIGIDVILATPSPV